MASTSALFMNLTSATASTTLTSNDSNVTFRYFGICVASFAIVVGGIGNLLTILAFASNRKLRTTFNVFIVNLSVVDFVTATLMMPFNLAGYVHMKWPFGNDSFTTRVQAYSYFCCGYTSVVFLIAITVNRFIGVAKPSQYNDLFSRNRLAITLVACWTLAPISLFPFFVGTDSHCPRTPGGALTGFHSKQFLCTFICLPQNGWYIYMQVTRVVFQFLPLAIMISLYSFIFYKMKRGQERLAQSMTISRLAPSLQASLAAGPHSTSDETRRASKEVRRASTQKSLMIRKMSSQSIVQSQRRTKGDMRMLVISITICVGFMITFLPSVIVSLAPRSWEVDGQKFSRDVRLDMLASNLSWFNCTINPIIYVILNRRFRKEYIRLVRMLFGQVKGGFVTNGSSVSVKEKAARGISNSMSSQQANSHLIVNKNNVGSVKR